MGKEGQREKGIFFFFHIIRHDLAFGFSKGRACLTMCMIKLVGFSRVPNAVNGQNAFPN